MVVLGWETVPTINDSLSTTDPLHSTSILQMMKMLMDVAPVVLAMLMLKLQGAEGGKYSTVFSM